MRTRAIKSVARRIKQLVTRPHWGTGPSSGSVRRVFAVTGLAIAAPTAVVLSAPAGPVSAAASSPLHTPARAGLLAGPAASENGWSIVSTPNATAPTGQLLFGTCLSASSCMAVGTYEKASAAGVTLAEQWNGTQWAIEQPPNPAGATVSALAGVACTQPSSCTAVGYWVPGSGDTVPLAEGWNGTQWRLEPTPHPADAQQTFLIAVACPSSSQCLAVGYYVTSSGAQVNLAERWDGERWSIQPTPSLANTQSYLDDVSCSAASACTAVGQTSLGTLAERWNGSSWQVQPTPNPSQGGGGLLGVACTSHSSCIAAGLSNAGPLAEAWNGTSWKVQPTPTPQGSQNAFLNGIGCSSSSACTAVGGYGTSSGGFVPLAERWNGTGWDIQPTPSPPGADGNFLAAVACPSRSACTAFGYSHGSGTPLTMAQQWTGTTWRLQRTPNPVGAAESQFYGVSCTSRSACIGVGAGGNGPLAARWNGTAWSRQPLPAVPGATLNGVSCTSPSACIAVGASATGNVAAQWNGTRWTVLAMPTPAGAQGSGMSSIACTSSSNCLAAGGYYATSSQAGSFLPLTERWNGTTWTILATPAPAGAVQTYLNGISCTSPSACTITGEQHFTAGNVETIAERWDGNSWTIQPTPNPAGTQFASLWGVDCTGPSACLATGSSDQGTLAERWDGTTWSTDPTPNPPGGGQLYGVACTSPVACTAIGFTFTSAGGELLAEHWNGSSWSIEPTPLIPAAHDMGLPAIACTSTSWCTAVGGYANDGPGSVTLAEQWLGGDFASMALPSSEMAAAVGSCAPPALTADTGQAMRPTPPWLRFGTGAASRTSISVPRTSPVRCHAG